MPITDIGSIKNNAITFSSNALLDIGTLRASSDRALFIARNQIALCVAKAISEQDKFFRLERTDDVPRFVKIRADAVVMTMEELADMQKEVYAIGFRDGSGCW